ncbi:glycosyl transferase [Lacihabitans sp. LS3-19]|uniref:glycosyltransferase family 39 protein n=1 Tax=Lacihabitans sp. LS3-19 TaxID=2487335 RepID=UPI0020CFB685|nr:glycosyltransferase family 39 protein [Lacihabitans sp. LS3-19]MCP9768453.1 glycosyl transferase [Lacihabitans sp. LS3-19]
MKKQTLILFGLIILKFVLQYLVLSDDYELHRDEFLHLDQAHHLAWGFSSVPPFTSWVSYIILLLGNGIFWIKFFPALFGALTLLVVWKTIEELDGDLFAFVLGAICIVFSSLLRINTLYQPNSFDILSWTSLYFFIIKYFKTHNPQWLFVAAGVFAIGFLNKYNIVFLLIGLIPAILLTDQRKVFVRGKLYLALLLGLLLIAPNLIWQYQNDFPVFHHLKQLEETQLVHVDRLGFLRSQLLFFIGALPEILLALVALLFYKPFQKYRAFFWSFVFTLLVFIYFKAKDYYAVGLYPVYIAFGSVFLANYVASGWKKWLRIPALAIPLLLIIPISRIAFPNKSPQYILEHPEKYKKFGLLRWEDGKDHPLPQDFADMLGWSELAHKVDSVYSHLPNADKTLILCDNYGQAGAINYYTKIGLKAVSFNADYINWFDLKTPYRNLIRIKEYEEKHEEFAKTSPYFEASTLADSITNPNAREYKTLIFAFSGAKIDINRRIEREIEEVKYF